MTRTEAKREYARKWYQKNKERLTEYQREYYKKNKARLKRYGMNHYSENRIRVAEIFGDSCSVCGRDDVMMSHHEIHGKPHSRGRSAWPYILKHPEDFVILCRRCHFAVHNIPKDDEQVIKIRQLASLLEMNNI